MIDRLPTETIYMIVGHLRPKLGDGCKQHRAAQNSLASLRRVSRLLATVTLQELYRFPIITACRYRKPLVSFLCSLRERHSLLLAVVNLTLTVSNCHSWWSQAFEDNLGAPYLTATRNLVLHSTSQPSRTADHSMLTSMLKLFPGLETLTADGVLLDYVASAMLYDAIKGTANLRHIALERASAEAITLLLDSSSKKEPNAVVEMTQLVEGPDKGDLYLTWTSGERRARGPLTITMLIMHPEALQYPATQQTRGPEIRPNRRLDLALQLNRRKGPEQCGRASP